MKFREYAAYEPDKDYILEVTANIFQMSVNASLNASLRMYQGHCGFPRPRPNTCGICKEAVP